MSSFSRELCLPACLGIGLALYAYGSFVMPRTDASIEPAGKAASQPLQAEPQPSKAQAIEPQSLEPQPIKLAPLKPKRKPAASPTPEVTGAINPKPTIDPKPADERKHAILPETGAAAGEPMPKVPGIRVAALAPQAVPVQSPDATRWSPAVGYAPLVRGPKPAMADQQTAVPPKAKRTRYARRPYRVRHTNFRVVIGVGPRW